MTTAMAHSTDPTNPRDETSFHANEVGFDNVTPAELGRLDPPFGWAMQPKPRPLTTSKGVVIRARDGKPLLDWDIPRYISSTIGLKRIEYWFRKNPKLSYDDIWARQPSWLPKLTSNEKNALSNRRWREVRRPLRARSFIIRSPGITREMVEHVEGLTHQQVNKNTTWDITPQGIAEPGKPERLLPLDYFCTTGGTHIPSKQISDAITELFRLQDLAFENNVDHWSKLDMLLLPKEWFMRKKKSFTGQTPDLNLKKSDRVAKKKVVAEGLATRKHLPRPGKNGKTSYLEHTSDETDDALSYEDGSEQSDPEDKDYSEDDFDLKDRRRGYMLKDKIDGEIEKKEARPCVRPRRKSQRLFNLDAAPDNVTAHPVYIPATTSSELVKNKRKADSDEASNTELVPKRARLTDEDSQDDANWLENLLEAEHPRLLLDFQAWDRHQASQAAVQALRDEAQRLGEFFHEDIAEDCARSCPYTTFTDIYNASVRSRYIHLLILRIERNVARAHAAIGAGENLLRR